MICLGEGGCIAATSYVLLQAGMYCCNQLCTAATSLLFVDICETIDFSYKEEVDVS